MNPLFEKVKSSIQEVVSSTKESKLLDEKKTLEQTKHDLLQLKENVQYASKVVVELQKAGWIDESLKQQWETMLQTPEKKKETLQTIADKVQEIHDKYDTLGVDEKKKTQVMTETLSQSRGALLGLKAEIVAGSKEYIENAEKKVVDQSAAALEKHWYSKWLVGPYTAYVHRKFDEAKSGKKTIDASRWEQTKRSLSDAFFGLVGSWFVGKEIADVVKDAMYIDAKKLEYLGEKAKEKIEKVQNVVETMTPEVLKKSQEAIKKKFSDFVQNRFHKTMTTEQLERVTKKIDMKTLLSENQKVIDNIVSDGKKGSNANMADAGLEVITLPFSMTIQVLSALKEEGIVDTKEIVLNVVGGTLEYSLKGFKMFGTGVGVVLGKIPWDKAGEQVSKLYNRSPDEAKELLFALMYRGQCSPIYKAVLNTAERAAKIPIFLLADVGDATKSLQNIADVYSGNIDTAIKQLEHMSKALPAQFSGQTGDLLIEFRKTVTKMKTINEITKVVASKNRPFSWTELERNFQSAGIKTADVPSDLLKTLQNSSVTTFTKADIMKPLGMEIGNVTGGMKKELGKTSGLYNFFRDAKGFLKGEANPFSMMEEMAVHLDDVGKNRSDMVYHESIIAKNMAKVKLIPELINEGQETAKTVFHCTTAKDFEEFVQKTKFLAKSSPASLKFLVGKAPVILVGGLALGQGDTMSEKMKALSKDLMSLVPIVGPWMIIKDGAQMNQKEGGFGGMNIAELGLGGVLITTDAITLCKRFARKDFLGVVKYMAQPVVDVWEIGKFLLNTGRRTAVLGKDLVSLAKTEGAIATIEGIGGRLMTKGRLLRVGVLCGLAAGAYMSRDYLFASHDLDDTTKKELAKYKDNPDALDAEIAKNRSTFKQEEKNEYMRAAVLRQGGFSPELISKLKVEYDVSAKKYTVVLPGVINIQEVRTIKNTLQDVLTQVEKGAIVDTQMGGDAKYQFTKELLVQFADIHPGEKKKAMEDYARAMGYDDPYLILDKNQIA